LSNVDKNLLLTLLNTPEGKLSWAAMVQQAGIAPNTAYASYMHCLVPPGLVVRPGPSMMIDAAYLRQHVSPELTDKGRKYAEAAKVLIHVQRYGEAPPTKSPAGARITGGHTVSKGPI
jgi:hypothetical protein